MEWRDGPVTVAARQGAVLCIDEIDYGAQNLSSLQRVLEGKPFLLKKKNEIVYPAEGFTIVATANTKGKGSEDGRYMFTNVLNEAFLERFLNTYEQQWPPINIERKILKKELTAVGKSDDEFAEKLVTWADVIRKTFDDGGLDEVISTRRLVHIIKTYGVFGNKMKSIELCLNRFDTDTKMSFLDLYTKVDAGANTETLMTQTMAPEIQEEEPPRTRRTRSVRMSENVTNRSRDREREMMQREIEQLNQQMPDFGDLENWNEEEQLARAGLRRVEEF
jgi:midasin (ATPase involved in ribosome maturation)